MSEIKLPEWVKHGAVFALDGKAYRILSVGSTNRRSRDGRTFEPRVLAELIMDVPWVLPGAPVLAATFTASIQGLLAKPSFYKEDLERAMYVIK